MADKIAKQYNISKEEAVKAMHLKKEIDTIGTAIDFVRK